ETIWRKAALEMLPWTPSRLSRSAASTALWSARRAWRRVSSGSLIPAVVAVQVRRETADTYRMRRPFGLIGPLLGLCAVLPVGALVVLGERMVMPPMWVHFYGVGVTALVATAAAVVLTTVGAREQDS